MSIFPYVSRPEDISRLLELLPCESVPKDSVDEKYIKSLGFSARSSNQLLILLQQLGFVDKNCLPSDIWQKYAANEERGLILAGAIKKAYPDLFDEIFCPYLEPDDAIEDFFRQKEGKISSKSLPLMVATFRNLNELADFQECMGEQAAGGRQDFEKENLPSVKVNPNLQLNLQIHIASDTPDEKIESIFKNLRKYLLQKEIK